ncbi:MAG: CapA family protein [Anaerolineales bacterium]
MGTSRLVGRFRPFIPVLLLAMLLLGGCSRWLPTLPSPAVSPFPTSATQEWTATAFHPVTSTPTPAVISLWIAPSVPDDLRLAIKGQVESGAGRVQLVAERTAALVRFEPEADQPLTNWIYALVARFPSTLDGMTLGELGMHWHGGSQDAGSFYLAPDTLAAIRTRLGEPDGSIVHAVPPNTLLTLGWTSSRMLSIVPFEELEPRWKVLTIDGWSPIQKTEPGEGYPLQVSFGLSGEPALRREVAAALDLPVTNRDLDHMTVVLMTGVTALTRATAWQMERNGINYPAEKIRDWLLEPDLTHISNEVSFTPYCPFPDPSQEGLHFCSDPKYISLLEWIDVDLIELTGNHGNDYGKEAFRETLQLYDQEGWYTFGGGENLVDSMQPVLLEHHGNKLAFIGCNLPGPNYAFAGNLTPGAAPCDDQIFDTVAELRDQGFLTIFTYQWAENTAVTTQQRAGFRRAVDAGAVIVSGSQAHQPMGMEFYHGGFIHYGLGNLFFDQMQTLPTRQEFLDRHVFYDGRYISTELLTAMLENYAQPRPMTEGERSGFLQEMFQASGW